MILLIMPSVEWNSWYWGISEDDYIAPKNQYIEWKNVDWLREGYGITLWPKPTKQIFTNWPIRWFVDRSTLVTNLWWVWDGWEIYLFSGTDNVPEHTLTDTNFDLTWWFRLWSYFYFVWVYGINFVTWWVQVKIAQINTIDATSWNWSAMNEAFETWLQIAETLPPITLAGWFAYIWNINWVYKLSSSAVDTFFNFSDASVAWITTQGITFKVYSITWNIYYWDGVSSSFSSQQDLWDRIQRVTDQWDFDYFTTDLWDLYETSWYSYNRIGKSRKSRRLNDNTQYNPQLDFSNDDNDGVMIATAKKDVFIVSNNKIYRYNKLISWLQRWFHSVLETDSQWNDIDEIYAIFSHERSKNLVYSYRSGTTYWIDTVDLTSLETAQSGYVITNIFRWPPNRRNKMKEIKITTSNTSGSNFIKLYKRINNGVWEQFRNINNDTDTIDRLRIFTETSEFIDIQFKIEFYNDNQDDTPPVLHHMELIYEIIEE